MKPRLLDLFCGAGGCACGYVRAGFEVVGVDNRPQKNYLKSGASEFIQADALEFCREHGHEFDAIHASPPCQGFTTMRHLVQSKHPRHYPDLLTPMRALLKTLPCPWVIENVPGAPVARGSTMLCGTMFGLATADGQAELRRHRYFETSFGLMLTPECRHGGSSPLTIGNGVGPDTRDKMSCMTVGVYGDGNGRDYRRDSVRDGTQQFSTAERGQAMGIDWMTGNELSQAIPPAYTEFVGGHLRNLRRTT